MRKYFSTLRVPRKVIELTSGAIQTPPGDIPVSPAPHDPALAEGLDWMVSRGPSNPNNSVEKKMKPNKHPKTTQTSEAPTNMTIG